MSIRLHPEHGLNPSMLQCFACGGDAGIALLGNNKGKEAPRHICTPSTFCQKCEGHMKLGIILIEARDGEKSDNPYRTGRQWVITEEAVTRLFDSDMAESATKKRIAFIEVSAVTMLGIDKMEPTLGYE